MVGNGIHFAAIRSIRSLWAALLYGALAVVASTHAQQQPAPTPLGVDVPHIALLLPVDSSTFRAHAEALRDGFMAAAQIPDPPNLLIRVYAVGEDPRQAASSYQQAVGTGARLVVGPLLRGAVNAIAAGNLTVPTLLLNAPDGAAIARPHLYVISLQVESEARQAARLAYRDGRRNALTVVADSPLLKRVHQAFVETFTQLGGEHAGEMRYAASPAESERLRENATTAKPDMAFLALDARLARSARAALDPLPLYASSQAYSADPALAAGLAGIRLLDMPWLTQRDHTAVMIYPRQNYADPDLDRLYALGIDAWRIGQAMLAQHTDISLDGVTGKLTLDRDKYFTRELVLQRMGERAGSNTPPGPVSPAATLAFPPPLRATQP
jgi:outer membrane PBP1 activator LpoA protein